MSGSGQRTLGVVAPITLVILNRLAMRAGLLRRVDGWRRAVGLVLRGEGSTFVLSAFGLDLSLGAAASLSPNPESAPALLARRLDSFLTQETGLHIRVIRGSLEDRAQRTGGPSYTLRFAAPASGAGRFIRPDDWSGDPALLPSQVRPDEALMNIVCRADHTGRADVWVRVNHVGTDGVPVQEMMTRLESQFASGQTVLYPTPAAFAPWAIPRPCHARSDLAEVQVFLDFAPLLAWRKQQNARLPEPMTVSAALLWRFAAHPQLTGLRMGTTVEVDAIGGLDRGVGVVVVRPQDHQSRPGGLGRYVRDFNRQLELTRRRSSGGCATLDAAARVSPVMARALLVHALEQGKAFGTLGLTILKDARVFGAPIAEAGHPDGFIAIGSMGLPTEDGSRVGCVTIKGPPSRIEAYPRILNEAILGSSPPAAH